ncbi:MAG: flippase-like domain-containing protein [Chloroflexota bacterium]|nr:flippase-like domain-containing protein [Chloroflexota bacterium]
MRRSLVAAAGILISLVAVWLLSVSVDLGATAVTLRRANPAVLLPVVGVIALQLGLRSVRWSTLLPRRDDGRRVRVSAIVPVLLIGYLGNVLLPARLGEGVRAVLIARRERLDVAEVVGTVVLERIVDTATLAVVALIAALTLPTVPRWLVQTTAVVGIIGFVAVVLVATLRMDVTSWLRTSLPALAGAPPVAALLTVIGRFGRGMGGRQRLPVICLAAAISTCAWLLDGVTFWLIAMALGINLGYVAALLVAAVAVLGTAIPSAPGYIGTFEVAATTTAAAIGVARSTALALAVMAHAVTVLPLAVGGAIAVAVLGVRFGGVVAAARTASPARPAAR